jgi:hypothetical protein
MNRFAPAVMTDGYEAVYRSLVRANESHLPHRRALSTPHAHRALPSFDGDGRPLQSFGPA